MSDQRKISCTLDGVYWSSNGHRNERLHHYENRDRSHLYEDHEPVEPQRNFPSLTHTAPRPQQTFQHTNQLLETICQTQAEILQELRYQNENYSQLVRQQQSLVSQDTFMRYLQHFEQSIAELREILTQNKNSAEYVDMTRTNHEMSVAVPTCFVKQEPVTDQYIQGDEEIANTLLTLGKKEACQTLHAFQSRGQTYYWSALANKGRDCLPISEKVSQAIEDGYQRLLYSNGQDPRVPRSLTIDDVSIYFDSREGTVGERWVRFERMKK